MDRALGNAWSINLRVSLLIPKTSQNRPEIDLRATLGPEMRQRWSKSALGPPCRRFWEDCWSIFWRFWNVFRWIWNDFDSKSATLNWAHQRKTYNPDSKIQYLEFKIQNPVPPFGLAGFAKRLQYVLHSAYYGIYIDTSRMHFAHPVPYQQVSKIAKPHTEVLFRYN